MTMPTVEQVQKAWTEERDRLRAEIERLTEAQETILAKAKADRLVNKALREKAEAERDAIATAAFETAAKALQNVADNWDCGHNESCLCDCARDAEQWGFAADDVRALTPADAQTALEAYGREKVREGMKRAADIGWVMAERDDIRGAILAEMESMK